MGLCGAAHGWGDTKKGPLPKPCHTYPTMVELGAVMPYLRRIQNNINQVTHIWNSTDTSILFTGSQ